MNSLIKTLDDIALFIVGAIAVFCFIVFSFMLGVLWVLETIVGLLWYLFCKDAVHFEWKGKVHRQYTIYIPWWVFVLAAMAIWMNTSN